MTDIGLQIISDMYEMSLHDIGVEAWCAVCTTRITGPNVLDTLHS